MVYDNEGDIGIGRKLRTPWLGPYVVSEKLTDTNYVLTSEANGATA